MNLIISGHHLEITPALRSYVQDKLASIARHFDHALDIKVLLSIDTPKGKVGQQKAECSSKAGCHERNEQQGTPAPDEGEQCKGRCAGRD